MFFHCSDRTCHLSLAKAAILTFQQKICDAGRGMQTNSEGMRCKESPVALYQEGERDRERRWEQGE